MNYNIDNFQPNLYINSVSGRFTEKKLLEYFNELNFGKINKIVLKKDKKILNSNFNDVYIYYDNWNIEYTEYIRYLLKRDKYIIIQYEDTYKWIVKASNNNN
jgi:hypothetical protein